MSSSRLVPLLLAAAVAGGAGWYVLRGDAPEVAVPAGLDTLEPDVRAVIDEQLVRARGRPRDAEAHARLAIVYEANDLWTAAVRAYEAAVSLDDRPLWSFHLARCLGQAGRNDEAVALLREVAPRLPDAPAAYHLLGAKLLEDGALDEAEAAFRRARDLAPDAVEPRVGLADVLVQRERYAEAAALLESALQEMDAKPIHYSLGLAYRGLGRMADAQRELSLGLGAEPLEMADPLTPRILASARTYLGRFTRAVDLIEAGNRSEGVAILQDLRASRPDDVNVLSNLGSAYVEMQRYDEAREVLDRAIRLDPEAFAPRINRAACALGEGDAVAALGFADEAVALAPDQARTHFVRARALIQLDLLPDAHDALRRAVELDSRSFHAYVALAEVSSHLGRPGESIRNFEQAMRLDPKYLPGWVSLVTLYLNAGRVADAATALAEAEKLAPDHERVRAARARFEAAR